MDQFEKEFVNLDVQSKLIENTVAGSFCVDTGESGQYPSTAGVGRSWS